MLLHDSMPLKNNLSSDHNRSHRSGIPRVSVVIPAYNVEDYIGQALDTLIQQKERPWEILIINDGSTDNTLAIAESYAIHYPFIRIITTTNQGVGKARDLGLSETTGDYVYFYDPDDYLIDELFLDFAAAHNQNPDIQLFCFNSETGGSSERKKKLKIKKAGWFNSAREVFQQLIETRSYTASLCLFIFKRNILIESGLKFERRYHEDHAPSMWLFMTCAPAYVSEKTFHCQRIRPGSLTKSKKQTAYVIELCAAYKEALQIAIDHKLYLPPEILTEYRKRSLKKIIRICKKNRLLFPKDVAQELQDLARTRSLGALSLFAFYFPYTFIRLRY